MRQARRLSFLLFNVVALAGCGSITVQPRDEPTRVAEVLPSTPVAPSATSPAPSPTLVPTATVAPSVTLAPEPTTTSTTAPSPTVEPMPTPISPTPTAPATSALTEYREPAGLWALQSPTDLLKTEELNQDITLFISADRSTVAAVDTYIAEGNEYGNTGENLRNRAQDMLALIYGKPVSLTDILSGPEGDWATGITFTTDGGSKGEAVYMQPGFRQGNRRVYGFIYGYKAANEATILPLLQAMRTSFQAMPWARPLLLHFVQAG
jgi:hypothetical protein